MTIQYIEPLSRAISRTRTALFRPVDLKKWFTVGFTAFLAGLTDAGFSGGPGGIQRQAHKQFDVEQVLYFPQRAWEWLVNNPGWAIVIALGLLVLFVFGIVITWLSSRGKFMFLDNVIHDRSNVVAPWYEYRSEGNSFFLFHLLWGFLVFVLMAAYVFYCLTGFQAIYATSGNGRALIVPAILAGLGFLAISLIILFVYVLFRDFVVLIMYRDRITASRAIQKFFPLLFSQPFHFIGYGLFLFCLSLVVMAGVLLFGCITCCIGFLILAIPYIKTVVLLPISYAIRSFSVEFLEQFGPEYRIFPRPDPNPPEPQSATV